MYIPPLFKMADPPTLHAFMRQHSFATFITPGEELLITHLPLLLDADRGPHGTLIGHFAKPNVHWQLDHTKLTSTAVFHGPHAYVSPSWYRSGAPAVPTWNYATVHASGKLSLIRDHAVADEFLQRLTAFYESGFASPWMNPGPAEYTSKMVDAIVAFELPIERIEGKFKLSQNRLAEDRAGAIDGLEATGDPENLAVAAMMREQARPSVEK